jgi:signal transduction histidine kinase
MEVRLNNHVGEVFAAANPDQLKQVFFNLELNAVRAMKPGGVLDIALFLSGERHGGVVIQFRDEGSGISPEHLDRIFHAGFSTKAGSPGLGLPVCQRIVRMHGGDIRVHSIEGEGSTFSVLLPISVGTKGAIA